MLIKQKRVRNIGAKLATIPLGTAFVVSAPHHVLPPGGANNASLGGLALGELRLPRPQGTVSRYNAEGAYRVHRNQPKESRYINTIEWTWQQWKGRGETETITEHRDVYRDCYPRTFMPPPSIELYPATVLGERVYVSPLFRHEENQISLIQHTVNLFLEIFGECELRKDDLAPFQLVKVRRVNWELLPPGRHPWSEQGSSIQTSLRRKGARYSAPIVHRQEAIQGYGPSEIAVGLGGFANYLAYLFQDHDLVLLESLEHGNATYVFEGDWEEFSQLTKAEILSQGLQKDRLIHSKGWENRLAEVLGTQPPLLRPV